VETKSIRLSKETYDRLTKLGDLSDSFDTVITKLMNENSKFKRLYGESKKTKLEGRSIPV